MSDQDFFFDEEDEKPAAKPKAGGGKAPATAPSKAAPVNVSRDDDEDGGSFFERDLNMGIASLLVVCALLLGMVAGVLVGQARANSALLATPTVQTPSASGGQSAPQLTEEQLNSGELPAGHPSISGAATSTTSSAETTGK